ncbi:MAG: RNA polymerase sigma factor [Phycisphaerales bacterium]|jgi:RNA polymerase sigma-70 factor (ECF subfamily)
MTRSYETIHDEMLVLAAQAGDAAAFASLLRRWLPLMKRHALRLTGDADAAEDVAQETCLALVSGLGRLQDPARAHGWMLRIVTHKAADWVRRRRLDRTLVRDVKNREPSAAPSDILSESQSGGPEQAARIRQACLQLPMQLREIVSLHYGEGTPLAVIAAWLEVPVGTIKSRLHEARAQLKANLERSTP